MSIPKLSGWHEGSEQTYDTSACSFSLGGLDVSATSCPKRFGWVKTYLDTGAAVNTCPLNLGPEGGDGKFYWTVSGDWKLEGGAWRVQEYDETGLRRSLNVRLTGAHKKVLGSDGGFIIPVRSKIGHEMRMRFERDWSIGSVHIADEIHRSQYG